jgi:F0F1-type ATP synthase assembly protein I
MNIAYLSIFMAGTGTVAAAVVYSIITRLQKLNYGAYYHKIGSRLLVTKQRTASNEKERQDRVYLFTGVVGGAFFGLLLTVGTGATMLAVMICAGLGAVASIIIRCVTGEIKKTRMMRELAVLYETIDFFTQGEGGALRFTIRQALQYGTAITPTIRPHVQRCIDSWPRGPVRALEEFAREVNLPEASILSTVLIHAEAAGMKYVRDAIGEGSKDLEELRQTLAEIKIAGKPVYYTVYRALPAAAVGGIVFGALLNHFMHMFSMLFSAGM